MLVGFDGVVEDGANGDVAEEGGEAAPEGVASGGDVREVAAGGRAGVIDHAEIAVEEDAALGGVAEEEFGGCERVRDGVLAGDFGRRGVQMAGDGLDLGGADRDGEFAAAVGAGCAVGAGGDLGGKDLERLGVAGGKAAPKGEILGGFGFAETTDFGGVGDHA